MILHNTSALFQLHCRLALLCSTENMINKYLIRLFPACGEVPIIIIEIHNKCGVFRNARWVDTIGIAMIVLRNMSALFEFALASGVVMFTTRDKTSLIIMIS